MEYRILFTGIGRRIELVQAFRQAANVLNVKLKIYGADMAGTAPALTYCDYARKVCSMKDENYISQLLEICQKDKIDLLIPTIDTDLLVLAKNKEKFRDIGVRVLISEPDKIKICRDKNNTSDFFEACGLKAPKTVNDYKIYSGPFPAFIKPKDGSSSINAYKVNDVSELTVYAEKIDDYIVQPYIEGREYTVDIFCDFDGNPIYIIPRVRMAVRSGEVLKTQIEMDETIIEECKALIKSFLPCGPVTVQLIKQNNTQDNYYIEINPRFGGGAPLSMKAGARSAEAILRLLSGEKITYQSKGISNGAVYSRFDQSVCMNSGVLYQTVKGVVFDLDDTLYSEKQYVWSGFQAVGRFLGNDLYAEKLWHFFEAGVPAIDALLEELHMVKKKKECIAVYRKHFPQITLNTGVYDLICRLKKSGIKVGIITDGRVEGQRNKVKALGLDEIIEDIIVTDELGGVQFRKPNDIAFRIMQCRWRIPFEQLVYVGDNLNKDFQAPRQLGMISIYYQNLEGLYYSTNDAGMQFIDYTVKSLDEIEDCIREKEC